MVIRRLQYHVARLGLIRQYVEEINADDNTGARIKALKSRLNTSEKKKKTLVKAIAEEVVSFEDAKTQMDELKETTLKLSAEIAELKKPAQKITEDMIEAMSEIDIDDLEFDEKRALIKAWIEKLELTEANLFIYYRFPIDGKGRNKERVKL